MSIDTQLDAFIKNSTQQCSQICKSMQKQAMYAKVCKPLKIMQHF